MTFRPALSPLIALSSKSLLVQKEAVWDFISLVTALWRREPFRKGNCNEQGLSGYTSSCTASVTHETLSLEANRCEWNMMDDISGLWIPFYTSLECGASVVWRWTSALYDRATVKQKVKGGEGIGNGHFHLLCGAQELSNALFRRVELAW